MPYNNLVTRTNTQAVIPEQVSNDLIQGLTNDSAALTLFPRINMPSNTTRFPVLATLPTAYFVNGDTGLKQTTEASWGSKFIQVEELAAIVPVPDNVIDDAADSGFDVWGNLMPLIQDAIARKLDAAIFFGVDKPATWPTAVAAAAVAAGNTVNRGTATAAQGGLATDISNAFATVEADGFDVNGLIARTTYKGILRNARDANGQALLVPGAGLFGVNPTYPMRGLWPAVTTTGARNVELIGGDFTQGILGIRKDFTVKLLTEGVITDNTGAIVYNLPQQDMSALRVTFRVGFQVANTLNYDQGTEASRYPFFVVNSPANA